MKSGFTLIELMVVVIIIGILAALAIPRFLGATERAKIAEWKAVAKEIVVLQNSYRMLHGEFRAADTWSRGEQCTVVGFTHPGGTSRFDYWTLATEEQLGGATLVVATGFHQIGEQGWLNSDAGISADGELQ